VLPRGASDLAGGQPLDDVPLIATKTDLIVRNNLARRIQYRLLDAAKRIHEKPKCPDEKPDIRFGTEKFPSKEATSAPLSAAAKEFYDPGQLYITDRFLADYLPRGIAEPIIDTLVIALIVIGALGILAPLVHLVPAAINWWRQLPILRLLVNVMGLEDALNAEDVESRIGELARQHKDLQQDAKNLLHRARARGVSGSPAAALLVMLLEERLIALRERLQQPAERGPEERVPAGSPAS
jgi:hypothetical protein